MNVFDVEPPQWLQRIAQPARTDVASRVLGQGIAATTKYISDRSGDRTNDSGDAEDNAPASFRQDLGEARLNQKDPFWRLKVEQLNLKRTEVAAQLAQTLQSTTLKRQQLIDGTDDQMRLSEIAVLGAKDPHTLLDLTSKFVAKSPQGLQKQQEMRMGAAQMLRTDTNNKAITAFWQRMSKIPTADYSTISQMPMGEDGLPSPQQLDALGKVEPKAKFESALGKLIADQDAIPNTPENAARRALFDTAIQQQISNKGRSIYMGMDDQGKPIFQMSEGGATPIGTPTVATESRAQAKLLKYEAATQLINDLQKSIKPEYIGAQGAIGEMAVDRGLSQLVPDMANRDRVDFRTGLIAARESLMREMSDDTRFSNADREEIAKALPSSGVFESLPGAQQRLETVRRILSQRGKIYSKGIGVKPPTWSMSKDEIRDAYKAKTITEQEAVDALEKFH